MNGPWLEATGGCHDGACELGKFIREMPFHGPSLWFDAVKLEGGSDTAGVVGFPEQHDFSPERGGDTGGGAAFGAQQLDPCAG